MVKHAERQFFLSGHAQGVKKTRAETLKQVAHSKKVPIGDELKIPPLPQKLAYLWFWWRELQTSEKLTYSELQAWEKLTKKNLSIFDVETIMRLENIFHKSCQTPPPA